MKFTLNELFEEVIPFMPGNLVSSETISLFKRLNAKFPAELISHGLFECSLGIAPPLSDLSLSVSDTGREILAGKREGVEIEESLLGSPVWKRIRSFCRESVCQKSYDNKDSMGLEFDLESLRNEIPLPGIFLNAHTFWEKDFSCSVANRYTWIIERLECLRGRPLKKETRDNLLYCLNALPDKGRLDYAAVMLSRPLDAVRVIMYIPEEELKDYLSLIKYPGEGQALFDLVEELSRFSNLRYNLDISQKVLSRIGIECFLKDKKNSHKEEWRKTLNHLVEHSLCIPEKRDALLDWLGHTYATLPQDTEPSYIFRRMRHIKIVYEKDTPLLAKAYPEFFRTLEMDLILERLPENRN